MSISKEPKVNTDQIEALYHFTRKHYVEHYDLQTELVDHLAQGIEQQWREDPRLDFEETLKREFKKFGIFGFHEVIEQRRKAMAKRYRGIIWRYFVEWWSMPKLMGTLALTAAVFVILRLLPQGDIKFGAVAGVFVTFSLWMFYRAFELKRKKEGALRQWMLQEMIYEQGLAVQLFILPMHLWNLQWVNGHMDDARAQGILALFLKICGYVIPSRAEELLAETYPEYVFFKN